MNDLDEFAIRIFVGLMQRHKEPGYSDGDAISEAYSLAEDMISHRKWLEEHNQTPCK